MNELIKALAAIGLDPSKFQIEAGVIPPSSGYVGYHFLNVTMPNGRQEMFSTVLTVRYPFVTAHYIEVLSALGPITNAPRFPAFRTCQGEAKP